MGSAKDIILKPISSKEANALVRRVHYSGKVVNNSQIHIGVYYQGKLEGAMQFGPSLDKRKIQGLVRGTLWNEFIELNRMAFCDNLPRNSESRALSIAFKLLRKHAPQIKWVISFADATQCGDGTIYRAAGFVLTGIHASENLVRRPDGAVIHKMTLESNPTTPRKELDGNSYYGITGGKYNLDAYAKYTNGVVIPGYQLRYIYFLDPAYRERLTVPVLLFSKIDEIGAGMYKGQKTCGRGETDNAPQSNEETGGASPTRPLYED